MYIVDQDSSFRRLLRHALALLGLAALILAAGLDHADAAMGPINAAAAESASWLAIASLGIVLFVMFRRAVPSRARRAAIARRRPAGGRGRRRRSF